MLRAFLLIIGVFLVWAVCIPLWGWAIAKLWLWFVVPLGLAPLSWAHAYGLGLLVSLTTHQSNDAENSTGTLIARAIISPLVFVFIGWIVLHWM